MTVWWVTLVLTFVLSAIARTLSNPVTSEGQLVERPNILFAFFAWIILVLVAGLRSGIGDTKTYMSSFDNLPSVSTYLSVTTFEGDWGFELWGTLIKQFISSDAQVFIFICSAITISLIVIMLYKYCGLFELGIFTFITAGNYLVTMNGVRQYLVSAILFSAFPLIYKKKWYIYFPLVAIVAQMHKSALIFIPIYFIVNLPAWGKMSKAIFVGGIGVFVLYPWVGPFIVDLLDETKYGYYGEDLMSGTGGANIIRTIVYAVPLILAYIGREDIKPKEKYYNIIVNMSIFNLIFMLLANKYWIFARFCMYFSLFTIILFCWCLKYMFGREKKLVYYLYLILFGAYYWYEMHISLGQVYKSDFIKF